MNLYRSFGNLMEAWVTEGTLDSDWPEHNDDSPSPPSDVSTNIRSESVDSGVETASSDISFPATSGCVSADLDTFTPESQNTPTSQSPVLSFPAPLSSSSSSPHLISSRSEQNHSTDLHSKVEQALLRTESKREIRQSTTVDEVLRRRPQSALLTKRHTSDSGRGQRSGSFGLKKSVSPSLVARQMSEVHRRPQSLIYDRQPTETKQEVLVGGEKAELSPGLVYLEHVCQMLEEIARQQLQSNALQMEEEALVEVQEPQEKQAAGTCQTDAEAAEREVPRKSFEKTNVEPNSSVPQQRRDKPLGHFRQRSASDTNLASLHLRRMKLDNAGKHLSSHDLLETEEDQENQECKNEATDKTKTSWRLKFGSFRGEDSTKCLQGQLLEKSSTRRRLSQLFKRRRKTEPV